jgi:glucose/arabinose dehydrogenase
LIRRRTHFQCGAFVDECAPLRQKFQRDFFMKHLFIPGAALAFCAVLGGCTSSSETVLLADDQAAPGVKAPVERVGAVIDAATDAQGFTLPRGFVLQEFVSNLDRPRRIAIAPGGTAQKYDVFVAESFANRVRVLRETNGDGRADSTHTFSGQFNQPYGMAFVKNSLLVANTDAVVSLPYSRGQLSASGNPKPVAKLTEGGYNQHWTRNLMASPDGKQVFVTVGSSCNTCEETDPQRAAISVMSPDGRNKKLFATGLRNPVGLAFRPGTSELWTVVNERDNMGDDIPPDFLTSVKRGKFYGWPYAYTDMSRGVFPDPSFGARAPEKVKTTTAPDVPVQAHSAALGVAFYASTLRAKSFPAEFSGDAFLAFHGSWNRSQKTGYKIVRVDFKNGKAQKMSDFVTGFLKSDGNVTGRPVDIQVAPDGSLLFSDDGAGKIWRVSYNGNSAKSAASSAPNS